jgi:poly(3-hydroxybutyrate) depolymerase
MERALGEKRYRALARRDISRALAGDRELQCTAYGGIFDSMPSTMMPAHGKRPAAAAILALAALVGTPCGTRAEQVLDAPRIVETSYPLPDGGEITYGLALPAGYDEDPDEARPLVLALHPGGRGSYYGSSFMRQVIEPGLRSWGAIFVAPDVPDRSWATDASSRAVLALLEHVLAGHAVDRSRILVTGYSMGGRGAWYFANRNPDFFTGAIPMAGAPGNDSLDPLRSMPVHAIQSVDDEVMPYEPTEATVRRIEAMGGTVRLIRLLGVGHYQMGAYVGPLQAAGAWVWEEWERRAVETR